MEKTSHSYELDICSQVQKTTSLSYAVISSGRARFCFSLYRSQPQWWHRSHLATPPLGFSLSNPPERIKREQWRAESRSAAPNTYVTAEDILV
jgi:hypothetical protein